jgi:hypothetical protein
VIENISTHQHAQNVPACSAQLFIRAAGSSSSSSSTTTTITITSSAHIATILTVETFWMSVDSLEHPQSSVPHLSVSFVCCLCLRALHRSPYPATGDIPSTLWGTDGSNASSRLLDFSYAGYREGQPIPANIAVQDSVLSFGAKGDGVTDDTAAVRAAIAATNCTAGVPCALFFPAGR